MENNGSPGKVDENVRLEDSTTKRRDIHKQIAKITDYPRTYEYSSISDDKHKLDLKNTMVNHYSTVTLNKSYIQSKCDTAIKLSISQPLNKTNHSNKLKHVDLKDYLKNMVKKKKHVKRSGYIYHPEVVTRYVYNRKDKLNYDVQPNHKKTQDFLKLLHQQNIVNELQYLEKKDSVNHINTDDWNTKYKLELSDTDKLNDNLEYLDTREHLNKIGDREKLNYVPKVEPITEPVSMIFNTESFAKPELINELDYKLTKQLDSNLDDFIKNEKMGAVMKSSSVATLKYFPIQIQKPKYVGKRDDDTEKKTLTIESGDVDSLNKDNEKYNIEHDYVFKQELDRRMGNSDKPWSEDNPEITNEAEYTAEQKYTTVKQKNEFEGNDYAINVFDLESTLNVENTPTKSDINLLKYYTTAQDVTYKTTTVMTTRGFRIQEHFKKTTIGLKTTQFNVTKTESIQDNTPTLTNSTGT